MGNTILIGMGELTLADVAAVADGAPVALSPEALAHVRASRALVEQKACSDVPIYGVSTGFGALSEIKIPPDQIALLQRNLVLSHAAGVGKPLSRRETRAMMLLRAQTLALGHSGVRPAVIDMVIAMLNHGIHPVIPEKGSVGASGDLAPLAHIALGIIGEGDVEYENSIMPAQQALQRAQLQPLVLHAKEGLSLVNGTQAMAALGTLTLGEAMQLCRMADIAGTMSLEGLAGIPSAFEARIQAIRPHPGQSHCADNIRRLLANSSLYAAHGSAGAGKGSKVQDPYSLRCMPQVHGATADTLLYAHAVLTREINSATDNPLVFAQDGDIVSGGNFHGQPLALVLDFAAIAMAELGNIAERRIEQMVNPAVSGLPAFLVAQSGIHSGYMMAQITAASLVNENKILATPASVDSIPGSASREDHVSMGMTSARKLREVVRNVEAILAIEMLCAAQAIDLRAMAAHTHAIRLGQGTHAAHHALRAVVPHLDADRLLSRDIQSVIDLLHRGTFLNAVEHVTGALHPCV